MPPTFRTRALTSPQALIGDLQSANLRLRLDNQALRRERDALRVHSSHDVVQAQAVAARLRALADEADQYVAALKADCHQHVVPEERADSPLPAPVAEGHEDATAQPQEEQQPSDAVAPLVDVLLNTAAPLRTMTNRMVPPIRGSALVERWKRRDHAPVSRASLPPHAFWTPAELQRLVSLLSDAFDENGQPAWGLLAAYQPKSPSPSGTKDAEKDAAARGGSGGCAQPLPRMHIFAGEALGGNNSGPAQIGTLTRAG
jgi:hypothetical protein